MVNSIALAADPSRVATLLVGCIADYAPSSRLPIRAPRPRSSIDLSIRGPLRSDQSAVLREAALAIGSSITGSPGIEASDPETLRSLLAWFWLVRHRPRIIAQKAKLQGANLAGADLTNANLTNANLTNANLTHANLEGANLEGANLMGANLAGTILEQEP